MMIRGPKIYLILELKFKVKRIEKDIIWCFQIRPFQNHRKNIKHQIQEKSTFSNRINRTKNTYRY